MSTSRGAAAGSIRDSDVDPDRQVGEIWFEPPIGRALDVMAKYLFTTERLSIQVHPDDETARERGYPSGKDECWIVLDVAEDAELGIGTVRELAPAEVMAAARDGSIVELMDWRRPQKGDFIYNPAGHDPRARPRTDGAGNPAGGRPHLSALRLWPSARTSSR